MFSYLSTFFSNATEIKLNRTIQLLRELHENVQETTIKDSVACTLKELEMFSQNPKNQETSNIEKLRRMLLKVNNANLAENGKISRTSIPVTNGTAPPYSDSIDEIDTFLKHGVQTSENSIANLAQTQPQRCLSYLAETALIILAKYHPLNKEDPITLEPLSKNTEDNTYCPEGYAYDTENLAAWFNTNIRSPNLLTQTSFIDPKTNHVFDKITVSQVLRTARHKEIYRELNRGRPLALILTIIVGAVILSLANDFYQQQNSTLAGAIIAVPALFLTCISYPIFLETEWVNSTSKNIANMATGIKDYLNNKTGFFADQAETREQHHIAANTRPHID
jgi:hypothetical protein